MSVPRGGDLPTVAGLPGDSEVLNGSSVSTEALCVNADAVRRFDCEGASLDSGSFSSLAGGGKNKRR